MKKCSILLLILICTQLYGCSNRTQEEYEIVPFDAEKASLESEPFLTDERDTKAISDDNDHIENATLTLPDIATLPEETAAANDSYYSIATDIPRADVENYAAQVKQQFLNHDWLAISSELSYPITISDVTYHNSEDFLEASNGFENILEEAFFTALAEEDCVEMFCNWQGIMLGETGQIWLGEVFDEERVSQGLKIITVNGLLTDHQ